MEFLKNDKILLRALEPEDLEAIYNWENDPTLWSVSSTLTPYSRYQLKKYIADSTCHDFYETKQLRLIIEKRRSHQRTGLADLFDFDPFNSRAALGILVDASSRKKGVALSAMNLLIEYAFKFLKLHQVYAHISADNKASIALFKSLGFKQSGILSEWVTSSNSRYEDVLIFQMINPEKTERLSLSKDLSDK